MSHVATIKLQVKDLLALKAACRELGLEFHEGQSTYKWYGRSIGDYPLPAGFEASDLGLCEHAISVAGKPNAYEIGVVRARNGEPGYVLLWDFWNGGYGLLEKVGQNAEKLKQAYALEVAAKKARQAGFQVSRKPGKDGAVQLVCTR